MILSLIFTIITTKRRVSLWLLCFRLSRGRVLVRARVRGLCVRPRARCLGSFWLRLSRRRRRRGRSRRGGLCACLWRVVVAPSVAVALCGLSPSLFPLFPPRLSRRPRRCCRVCSCWLFRFAFPAPRLRGACLLRGCLRRGFWARRGRRLRSRPRRGCPRGLSVGGCVFCRVGRVGRRRGGLRAAFRRARVRRRRLRFWRGAACVSGRAVSVRPVAVGVGVALLLRPRLRLVGVGGLCGGLALAARGVSVRLLRAPVVGRVAAGGRRRLGFGLPARSSRRPACAFLGAGFFCPKK